METIKLKNGAVEAKPLVVVMMLSLKHLMDEKPIAFYELVMKCRDPEHKFFGATGQDLQKLNLVGPDGTIHSSVRNIVLSATSGEGLVLKLHSPIA